MITRHLKLKTNRKSRKMLEAYLWRLIGVYNWTIRTIESELSDCKALVEGPLPEFQERLESTGFYGEPAIIGVRRKHLFLCAFSTEKSVIQKKRITKYYGA